MLRLWLVMSVGVAFLVASGVVASMARAQPTADPMAVITAYEMARNRRDVDTALSFFAENAVVSQRNTTYAGKDDIRKYLETVASRARFIVVSDRHVTGNLVTWTERSSIQTPASTRPLAPPQGNLGSQSGTGTPGFYGRSGNGNANVTVQTAGFTVTVDAVVQDGKIQSMAYNFATQGSQSDLALESRAQLPAALGFAAVLLVLVGMLGLASIGLRRATPVPSSLHGRLMQDLQGWAAARE